MTTRAIPQVLMNWLQFGHTFGSHGWIGIGIVFSAILLRVGNTLRIYRNRLNAETENSESDENKSLNRLDEEISHVSEKS